MPSQRVPQHLSLAGQHSSEWFALSCDASISVRCLIFNNTVVIFTVLFLDFVNKS